MKRREKVLSRIKFRRFSTVQLLIAFALFFIFAPFVEEVKGGHLILLNSVFPGPKRAGLEVATDAM